LAEPLDNIPTEEELNIKKQFFLDKLGKIDLYELERTTKDQSHSQEWYIERKKRLTASNFGDVCKMRASTSCQKKVYSLLYRPNTTTKAMTYGVEMECLARNKYEELYGVSVEACGLFADIDFPFLAASPGNIWYYLF